jgi:hypothetical protein
MNKIILVSFLFIATLSCKNKTVVDNKDGLEKVDDKNVTAQQVVKKVYEKIIGSFVGTFGDNKITMLISKAEGDSVAGRTIVGGNDRPFAGLVAVKDGIYTIAAKEPGDDKNDGTFNVTIAEANNGIVQGNWVPNDAKVTTKKDFVLQRKVYAYKVTDGSFAVASQKLLKEEDVSNLTKYELEMMRNEIFARHGYCFKKKELRQRFEKEEWYVPDNIDVKDRLTEIEKKNITLMKRFEKYADEFGDDFGR